MRKGYDELTRYEEFKFKKVGDLVNLSGRNSTLKIAHDATLWTAMNAMVLVYPSLTLLHNFLILLMKLRWISATFIVFQL